MLPATFQINGMKRLLTRAHNHARRMRVHESVQSKKWANVFVPNAPTMALAGKGIHSYASALGTDVNASLRILYVAVARDHLAQFCLHIHTDSHGNVCFSMFCMPEADTKFDCHSTLHPMKHARRMKPAMKCYKTTQFVTSGVCKGVYLTGFCAVDQKEVSEKASGRGWQEIAFKQTCALKQTCAQEYASLESKYRDEYV